MTHPKPWWESCLRWDFGTGSCPLTRWPVCLAAVKSPKAPFSPGQRMESVFLEEPPRNRGSHVVNTAGVHSDRERR